MVGRLFAIAASLGLWASLAQAHSITVMGSLPRDLSVGRFDIFVRVDGVKDGEHLRGANDPLDEQANLASRFRIFLTSIAATKPVFYQQGEAAADAALPLFASEIDSHNELQMDDGTWSYFYDVRIAEASTGALARLLSAVGPGVATVQVDANFYLGGLIGSPVAKLDFPVLLQQSSGCEDDDYTNKTFFEQADLAATCFARMYPMLTDAALAQASDVELGSLLSHAVSAAFYSREPEQALAVAEITAKLDARGRASDSKKQVAYSALVGARLFLEAQSFAKEHAVPGAEPLPGEIRVGNFQEGAASVYTLSNDGETLLLESPSYRKGGKVIVVGSPGCHFFLAAMASVMQDDVLRPLFETYALMIEPQGDLGLKETAAWNRDHPALPLHLTYLQKDWRDLPDWGMPTFYFFRDGSLVKTVSGLGASTRADLVSGFDSISRD